MWKAEWDCLCQGGAALDGLANSPESVTPLFLESTCTLTGSVFLMGVLGRELTAVYFHGHSADPHVRSIDFSEGLANCAM